MAFQFSLETLLRVRTLQEESEERKLLLLRREVEVLHREIATTEERIAAHLSARSLTDGSMVRGRELSLLCAETDDLHEQLKKLRESCFRAEALEREQRSLYQAARQQKEVVLELKKKQRQLYEKLLRRKEQKTADEMFLSTKFMRL